MSKADIINFAKDEANDQYSDDSLFSISSWGADLSFRELISRYQDDELVKPELQRNYIWDKTEASRFIDSVLLGLPVPSIFLAKTGSEKMLIVDGYQRIMTIHDYVVGVFSTDGKIFKLANSDKINKRWKGKAFAELSSTEQRRIRNTTIHSIIFVQDKPKKGNTSLFQVFERINTSSRSLTPQEIRNCIYQGDFNSLLFELNSGADWRALFGRKTEEPRMRDMEFILRFYALQPKILSEVKGGALSLKKHLNLFMENHASMGLAERKRRTQQFIETTKIVREAWGDVAFHNLSPTREGELVRKFSPTIFDSIAVATAMALSRGVKPPTRNAEKRRRELLRDEEYKFVITQETMRLDSIKKRVTKALRYLYDVDYEQ